MSYEELKNKAEESEILSREHEKVRGMCGGLKRVNAPKNFDFHLKARIANCDRNDFQQNAFLPFLRYAIPLCVVLLLAGFVVFSGILTGNQNTDTTLVQNLQPNEKTNPAAMLEKTDAKVAENTPSAVNANVVLASANTESPKSVSNVQVAQISNKSEIASSANKNLLIDKDFGGTRESSSRDSQIINPPGISPKQNSAAVTPADMNNNSGSSVRELLNLYGIEATFVNSGWKVKSTAPNSLASRIGVKIGDIIEATDTLKLNTETITERNLTIKNLHVLREGRKVVIEFR